MEQLIAPVGWLQPVQETCCALSQVADPRPLCQSAIVSGTLLHADRVDSATGCMSCTCKGVVTEHSAEVSGSDICML